MGGGFSPTTALLSCIQLTWSHFGFGCFLHHARNKPFSFGTIDDRWVWLHAHRNRMTNPLPQEETKTLLAKRLVGWGPKRTGGIQVERQILSSQEQMDATKTGRLEWHGGPPFCMMADQLKYMFHRSIVFCESTTRMEKNPSLSVAFPSPCCKQEHKIHASAGKMCRSQG